MTEDNKYYTPSLEEFRVGFRYEAKQSFMDGTVKTKKQYDLAEWEPQTTSVGDLPYIERALNGKNAANGLAGIRVKHLDHDDIVECGWEPTSHKVDGMTKYTMDMPTIMGSAGRLFWFSKDQHNINIEIEVDEETIENEVSNVIIRNINELQDVMRMVGINS